MPTTKTVVNRLRQSFHLLHKFLIQKLVAIQDPDCTFFPEFVDGGWQLKPQPERRIRLINILSRQLYREFNKSYPIADLADLKQVLSHSYGQNTLHQIGPTQQGGREVVSYQIAADFFADKRFPACWVPISWLLSKTQSDTGFTAEIKGEYPWYLAAFSQHSYSQLRNALTDNLSVFRLTQGVPDDLPHLELEHHQSQLLAIQTLGSIKPAALLTFISYDSQRMFSIPWRPYAVSLAVVATLYMATASLALQWQSSQRTAAMEAMGDELNALLAKQDQLAKLQSDIQALSQAQQHKMPLAPAWLLLNQLNEFGAVVLDINQRKRVLTIRGQAQRATDILTQLRQHSLVQSADFSAPVIKVQGKDEFSMRVELRAGTADATQ